MENYRKSGQEAGIEWELLPSLRANLFSRWRRQERPYDRGGIWADTLPSAFDRPCRSEPFQEIVPGLAVREVAEPDIFHIFFGRSGR